VLDYIPRAKLTKDDPSKSWPTSATGSLRLLHHAVAAGDEFRRKKTVTVQATERAPAQGSPGVELR